MPDGDRIRAAYNKAAAAFDRANGLANSGRHAEAVGLFSEAIDRYLDIHRRVPGLDIVDDIADSYFCLGNNLAAVGRSEEAIDAHENAQRIYQSRLNYAGVADSLDAIGADLQELGRFEEAVHYHESAIRLFRQIGKMSEVARASRNRNSALNSHRGWP
jgi:tetratricopeptide (TPR) repeat protein